LRRRSGFTLIELLVYGIILAIASSTVLALVISIGRTQSQVTAQPTVQAQAQDALTAVAAYLRRAPLCDAEAGCTDVVDSAFKTANNTSLDVYTSSAGSSANFSNTNGALIRTQGAKTATIIPDSLTIRFQYVLSPSLAYTMGGTTDSLAWQDSVAREELKAIVAVKITATVARDNVISAQSSVVRLRNSPKKVFTTS
jgi:type II secretory pathway component PulJ